MTKLDPEGIAATVNAGVSHLEEFCGSFNTYDQDVNMHVLFSCYSDTYSFLQTDNFKILNRLSGQAE